MINFLSNDKKHYSLILLFQCHKMKLPPSAVCRRRFTFVNRHQFPIFKKQNLSGGADRDRTCDLLNANQALSQLSYSPKIIGGADQVGLRGLEPRTSSLSGMRSNQPELQAQKLGMRRPVNQVRPSPSDKSERCSLERR